MTMPTTWKRPSLACMAIEASFPGHSIDNSLSGSWTKGHLHHVRFLLDVLREVDDQILFTTLSPEEGLAWRRNLAAIEAAVDRWQGVGRYALNFSHLVEMYALLRKCPDQIAPKAGVRLRFIHDRRLRTSIARDIDALESLVRDEEWKSATVIGGSVTEALLLEQLVRPKNAAAVQAARTARVANKSNGWPSRLRNNQPTGT